MGSDYLLLLLLAASGLICSVAVLASRSSVILALVALGGTTVGFYLADKMGIPPNLVKVYLSAMFAAAFVWPGVGRRPRTHWWEYLLLAFFVGRVIVDATRLDFGLRSPFGGLGDGVFLIAAYLYFKRAFASSDTQATAVVRSIVYCTLIIAVFGVCESLTGVDLFGFREPRFLIEGRIRANSIFSAPEHFGTATALGIYLSLFLYTAGRQTRSATLWQSGILSLGLVASLYRGIWIAFLAGMVVYFVVRAKGDSISRMGMRLLMAAVVLGGLVFAGQEALRHTAFYAERISNAENVDSRMLVYRAIMRGVADQPWLGHGTGTVTSYLAVTPYNPTVLDTPHSVYLGILFDNGVTFLVLYLAWFATIAWNGWARRGGARAVLMATIMMILISGATLYLPLSCDYPSMVIVMVAALAIAEGTANGRRRVRGARDEVLAACS